MLAQHCPPPVSIFLQAHEVFVGKPFMKREKTKTIFLVFKNVCWCVNFMSDLVTKIFLKQRTLQINYSYLIVNY